MITFTDYQLQMAISRAYNAGKQAILDQKDGKEFRGSDNYFKEEFPENWYNINHPPELLDDSNPSENSGELGMVDWRETQE